MKYVKLSEAEEITILEMRKFHSKPRVRERAQMVELSNKKQDINEIVKIVGKNRDTVSTWLNKYEKYGIAGLFDEKRSGRNPIANDPIKARIIEIAESDTTCTSKYIAEIIEDEFNVKLHPDTIKYNLKKQAYTYKRTRTSLKKKRDQKKFDKAKLTLDNFKILAEDGKINLIYIDESGFSGNLPVNYSWIKIGKEKCIEKINDRSIKVNSLGMFNYAEGDFSWATTQETIDSDMFIGLFELARSDYKIPTFIVLDNYSIHRSKKVKAKIKEWAKEKLFLYYLPPYSPEFNLIENKWKNLKYNHIHKRHFGNRDELETTVNKGIFKMCANA